MKDTFDRLKFDIGFQIGRTSKSDLNDLKGPDGFKRDAAQKRLAERICAKLRESYDVKMRISTAPTHTISFGSPSGETSTGPKS